MIVANKDLSIFLWTVKVSALSMQELTNCPPLKLAQLCFCSLSLKHVNTQEKTIAWNAIANFISGIFSKPHTTTPSFQQQKNSCLPLNLLPLNHINNIRPQILLLSSSRNF